MIKNIFINPSHDNDLTTTLLQHILDLDKKHGGHLYKIYKDQLQSVIFGAVLREHLMFLPISMSREYLLAVDNFLKKNNNNFNLYMFGLCDLIVKVVPRNFATDSNESQFIFLDKYTWTYVRSNITTINIFPPQTDPIVSLQDFAVASNYGLWNLALWSWLKSIFHRFDIIIVSILLIISYGIQYITGQYSSNCLHSCHSWANWMILWFVSPLYKLPSVYIIFRIIWSIINRFDIIFRIIWSIINRFDIVIVSILLIISYGIQYITGQYSSNCLHSCHSWANWMMLWFVSTPYKLLSVYIIFRIIWIIISLYIRLHTKILTYCSIVRKYKIYNKYHVNNIGNIKGHAEFRLMQSVNLPVVLPDDDLFGYELLALSYYYAWIKSWFNPIGATLLIIDSQRGHGKTSFINLLENNINHYSYRDFDNCKLFWEVMGNSHIHVVRLTVNSFFSRMHGNYILNNEEQANILQNILEYIMNNIDQVHAAFIRSYINNIKKISLRGFSVELNKILHNQSVNQMKEKLFVAEKYVLIIIEDIDRLDKQCLKILSPVLWFLYEMPFTSVLLPGDADLIMDVVNFYNRNPKYQEPEQYKLISQVYRFSEDIYNIMASRLYIVPNESLNKLKIEKTFDLIASRAYELFQNQELTTDNLKDSLDGWTKEIFDYYKYKVVNNDTDGHTKLTYLQYYKDQVTNILESRTKEIMLHIKPVSPSLSLLQILVQEIKDLLTLYKVSIREYKYIVSRLASLRRSYSLYQQIVVLILEYRYPHNDMIKKYITNFNNPVDYYQYIDILKNSNIALTTDQLSIINTVKEYPLVFGVVATYGYYLANVFGIINHSAIIKHSLWLTLTTYYAPNVSRQEVYSLLHTNWQRSTEWHNTLNSYYEFIMNKYDFIILFHSESSTSMKNIIYIKPLGALSKDRETFKTFPLYFYQNMAIFFLLNLVLPEQYRNMMGQSHRIISLLTNYNDWKDHKNNNLTQNNNVNNDIRNVDHDETYKQYLNDPEQYVNDIAKNIDFTLLQSYFQELFTIQISDQKSDNINTKDTLRELMLNYKWTNNPIQQQQYEKNIEDLFKTLLPNI